MTEKVSVREILFICDREEIVEPRDVRILLKYPPVPCLFSNQLELSIYRYLHPPRPYLEALRARLISAEQYSVSGIFVPSYRKNQRARNLAPMCLFSIPSFPRPAIKSCCWKYYLGESPHPRYTGSLQSVGRDSPSFSDSHWWISII